MPRLLPAGLLDPLQHGLQHVLAFLLALLRVIHGRLAEGELGLDILDLLLPFCGLNPPPTRCDSAVKRSLSFGALAENVVTA